MEIRIFLSSLVLIPLISFGQIKDNDSLFNSKAFAEVELLNIDPNDPQFQEGRYNLGNYLYVLVDSTRRMQFSDIFSPENAHSFVPFLKAPLQELSMSRQPFWLRLSIKSNLDHEEIWLTNFMEAEVASYSVAENGRIEKSISGLLIPLSERPYKKQYGQIPVLPLTIPGEGFHNYYWRVQPANLFPDSDYGIRLNYSLFSPSYIAEFRHLEAVLLMLGIGFAIAVGVYHLVIFFYIKESSYLWFACYCITMAFLGFIVSGYALSFFWSEIPLIHYTFISDLFPIIYYLFLILFTRSYLQTYRLIPGWDKVLWLLFGLLSIDFLLTDLLFVLNLYPMVHAVLAQMMFFGQIVLLFIFLIISVICIGKGYQPAKFYLFANTAFILGFIFTILNLTKVLPMPVHGDWVELGWVIQMSLFALGLAQLFKSLQKKKFEAERLKELDHIKTRLYTNITHEFRTPITVILGMAEQALNNPKDWFREGTHMIIRNGKKLLKLVNQMLDLSKVEAGSLPVNLVQSDIVQFLRYLVEPFYAYAETKNIQLYFRCKEESLNMDYDPEKLTSIISNLLSNAIKFTQEGGSVYLEAGSETANSEQQGQILLKGKGTVFQIKVTDTGIGVPKDKLPFIFDRFYQVRNDELWGESRKTGGTGIGLALTKELVKLLGGTISAKSKPGEGSEFSVSLPISQTATTWEETPDHFLAIEEFFPFKNIASERIETEIAGAEKEEKPLLLIIEDNPDIVSYLSACLKGHYHIKAAYDGKMGVEKALELIPDIIISDVMMPEADGFEVCQILKNNRLTSHIPIVLLTAKVDHLSRIEGLQRGADAYLAKPFNKKELLVRLQKLIELRHRLQEYYQSIPLPEDTNDPAIAIESAFIKEIQTILEAHLDDQSFSITDLCPALGISRAQLYRKFKALTGQPVGRYFRTLRLHKAKTLLQTTDLNISEIAYETGFKDPSHFTHAFKEEFEMNPREARHT